MKRPMSVADLLAAYPHLGAPRDSFSQTLLANLSPLPWHQFFNEALPVTLAANASRQLVVQWPQVGQEQANTGLCAIVDGAAMGTLLLADLDNIVWSIMVNDTPVVGYDFIKGPFGVFIYPKPVLIPVLPGSLVKIVASNLTAVAIPQVTAYLMGRSFPTDPNA